jgi:hypothetical protein
VDHSEALRFRPSSLLNKEHFLDFPLFH